MRDTLEDLYFGNITPNDQIVKSGTALKKAMERSAECEEKLTALLEDKEKALLLRLINAENEIGSTMALENFILGFRLGVRMILEALDEDDGTVRLRKDGRWEGRVVVGYDEAGNPKTKNVLAKTKKECVEKLEQLKEQCGNHRPTQVRPDMPFGAWLDYWYQNFSKPRLRPTTQLGYEGWIYNHLISGLGSIQLNRLTQADLQQFFRTMKERGRKNNAEKRGKGMADRSVRSCHAVCQMALDRAVEAKLIHGNPAAGCRLPPIKGREMQVLTQEEMRRFLIQAKAEGMYELFLLDLTTGMRRGELLALRWDDLDFATGKLRIDKQFCPVGGKLIVSEPKTKAANRAIILPPAMLEVLAEYKKGIFSDLMFPSRIKPDQPIDPGYVRKRLQVILKRAGCKSVRFHDLRHTFATMSLENEMDVKTLSAIIGHVSSATNLNTYTPGSTALSPCVLWRSTTICPPISGCSQMAPARSSRRS